MSKFSVNNDKVCSSKAIVWLQKYFVKNTFVVFVLFHRGLKKQEGEKINDQILQNTLQKLLKGQSTQK